MISDWRAKALFTEYHELLSTRRASGAERTERLARFERWFPTLVDYRKGLIGAVEATEDIAMSEGLPK